MVFSMALAWRCFTGWNHAGGSVAELQKKEQAKKKRRKNYMLSATLDLAKLKNKKILLFLKNLQMDLIL